MGCGIEPRKIRYRRGPRVSIRSKATCAAPLCEVLSPCRGLRPHHVQRDRTGKSEWALDPRRLRMGEFSRRDMLGAAAAGGMVAAATSTETFGQGQPPFWPTPAPLAGAELPSFRFRLGAVAPKSRDRGWAKEATVVDFPMSQALAGVLMSLVPGGLRELHWHANAAEWAYVIKGQCRVTTINPQGQSQIVDFNAGDVWYFPRGFGHSIQGIGSEDCLFVLVFDNGSFFAFVPFSIR